MPPAAPLTVVRITRADGLIPIRDAALLCDVTESTVRNWISRGYYLRGTRERVRLPVAAREGRMVYLDPVEVAKAEYHTAKRARRDIFQAVAA